MANFRREEARTSFVNVTSAASTTIVAFQQLAKVLAESAPEEEKQAENIYTVAESLGVLNAVLANNLTLTYAKAMEASNDFRGSLDGLAGNSYAVEMAVREQLNTMLQAIADTKNFKGSVDDLLPVLNVMYNDILAGASDADMSREAILQLIDSIGILDSLEPDVRLAITMNADELKAQIESIRSAISELMGDSVGRNSAVLKGLRDQLATFTKLSDAIGSIQSGRSAGRRSGGGGGGGAPKPSASDSPFAWVEGWTKDIAGLANSLIGEEFARTLFEGTPEQVVTAFDGILKEVERLGLDKLPQFASVFESIGQQVNQLIGNISEKNRLQTDLEDAVDLLNQLGSAYDDVRREAGRFDPAISGAIAPSETALDRARNAQAEYERLLAESNRIAQESETFKQNLARSIAQPLTAQGSAMSQTSKTLKNARAFRNNLIALRDKGFPPELIAEVAQAGIVDGNRIANSLLALGGADLQSFLAMRAEIASIANETGNIAANIIFGADIADAEGALGQQRAIVNQLFANAISEANAQFEAQRTLVTGLEESLASVNTAMNELIHAIQVDLFNAFAGFLAGLPNGLNLLSSAPVLGSASTTNTTVTSNTNNVSRGVLSSTPTLGFGGFMAKGGIAVAPTLVAVGEAGPEAIVPLTKLDAMGGDTVVYVTIEGSVTSERDLVEAIRRGLLQSQKSGKALVL
jgi:hypothetical protein